MNTKLDWTQEAGSSFLELFIVIALAIAAGVYLYRKYFIKKGCAGCASSGKAGGCSSSQASQGATSTASRSADHKELMQHEQVVCFRPKVEIQAQPDKNEDFQLSQTKAKPNNRCRGD